MGMHYKHITKDERIKIEALRKEGYSNTDIAEHLGRNRSTIGREFERNYVSQQISYRATPAEKRRRTVRAQANLSRRKLVKGNTLEKSVESMIQQYWSPEQVAGVLRKRNHGKTVVSHEVIYQYIYKHRTDLLLFLRQSHKRRYRRRRGTKEREKRREQKKKRSIEQRPKIVEKRKRLGDWEAK